MEEAWKALSSANMAEYLRYMYKTVRKYYGEAIVEMCIRDSYKIVQPFEVYCGQLVDDDR